jgi:hypothetical protein
VKTKDEVKKSWSAANVAQERLRSAEGAGRSDGAACPAPSSPFGTSQTLRVGVWKCGLLSLVGAVREPPYADQRWGIGKKMFFSGKRTQSSIAAKGLSGFCALKTNWFLMQTNSKRTPQASPKPTLCAKLNWRAGADVVFERLRCAQGAGRSDGAACPVLSLRDIADPANPGSAPSRTLRLRAES